MQPELIAVMIDPADGRRGRALARYGEAYAACDVAREGDDWVVKSRTWIPCGDTVSPHGHLDHAVRVFLGKEA